jgi:hypothetical protein
MRRSVLAISLSLLTLILIGCAQKETPPTPPRKPVVPAFQVFKSPKGDFEISYAPAIWEVEKDTSVALSLKHKTEDAIIQLVESDLGGKVTKSALKMFADMTISGVKEGSKDFKEVGKADTTFAGQPAHEVVITTTEEGKAMKMKMLFFASEGKAYAFIIGGGAEVYDKLAPDIEKTLNSFKLVAAVPAKPVK